ncbi:MAG: SpaA isopeptide-forming pilin-related protein, partial [Aedoeadaptatus pacaensis]
NLDKKWVIVVDKNLKAKVYNYTEGSGTGGVATNSLFVGENTYWVDVAHRPLTGWDLYDNRWQGWVGNSPDPYKMGTRIIGINKKDKYVIQRYILNPEGYNLKEAKVEIHREKPNDQNMTWFKGNEEFKVYKLTKKPVTVNVEDFRLADYGATEITQPDFTTGATPKDGEPDRKSFDFKNITGPIVIDVKVPYDDESGGVGTGMDLWIDGKVYWKSDYYERVSDIVLGEPVDRAQDSDIIGSYIADGSLDVTNEQTKYSFKLKKVKDDDPNTTIQGATFSLTGPGENGEKRTLVTDEKGIIQFNDLVEGTYKLEETSAAPGYDKVKTNWTVTITKEGKVFMKDDSPTGKSAVWDVATDTTAPAHQMSRSAMLNDFLAPFGEEAAPVNAQAPMAEEAVDGKERAEAEAASATSEDAKDAATVSNAAEKKETAAEASEPISEKISTTKQLNNFLTTFGANSGLELGEEIVPSPVGAESDWEKVDPARSEGINHRHTSKTEAPMDTKILEINKVDN